MTAKRRTTVHVADAHIASERIDQAVRITVCMRRIAHLESANGVVATKHLSNRAACSRIGQDAIGRGCSVTRYGNLARSVRQGQKYRASLGVSSIRYYDVISEPSKIIF